jgi:adenine deaminase
MLDVEGVGEKMVAVAFPGMLPAETKHVIDAGGKMVVPGGIETHVHAVASMQLIPRKIDLRVLRRPAF